MEGIIRKVFELKKGEKNTKIKYETDFNVFIRMYWQNYLVEKSCLLKNLKFPQGFTKGMRCFINWFTWFLPLFLHSLASITFRVCVCVCVFVSVRHSLKMVSRLIIQSMELESSLPCFLVLVKPKHGFPPKQHTTGPVFVWLLGVRVRDSSLSRSTRGRWCSWGSLINSSRAFITSLMGLVSAYQSFDYLPYN